MSLIKKELTEKSGFTMEFSVSEEAYKKAENEAYKKNVKSINVPGFRKGKAPKAIIEKYYGKGIFFETTKNTYVDSSCINAYTKETLAKAGFGEYAYYFNDNFDGVALANPLQGGKKHTITMRVFDCKGNLDDNSRGAFVLLNMTGGGQNSAECNYKIKAVEGLPGVYDITFIDMPPSGTDTLRFYQIEPCEFYIASITVKIG